MTDPFAHHGHYHPSVNAAIAAREKRERIEAAREREPEPDLREAVRELAEIVYQLTVQTAVTAIADSASSSRLAELRDMRDRASEIARRLT